MATFAGTSSDDYIIPTTNGVDYRGGQGNDTYILTNLIPASATIVITDTEGANKIQLADGLTIASSSFFNNAAQLTLSNGAKVQITGASSFTYDIGANVTAGDTAASPNATYAAFATTLGATVPAAGAAATAGTANYAVPVTGAVSAPTFTVTGATAAAEATTASFVVSLANRAAGVAYGTTVTLAATGGSTAGTDFTNALTLDAASTAAGITLVGNVLTIPAASAVSSVTLTTAVAADAVTPETGEGLSVTLSAPTGASAVIGTASAVTTAITDAPLSYTMAASAATVYEGAAITYTVTASANVLTDTVIAFSVVPGDATAVNQGTSNTNLNDFSAGSFNPSNVTMLAGTKTATYTVTSATDSITELPEAYSVKAVIGSTTLTTTTSLLDGGTSTVGATYTLTTSADNPPAGSGDDTFNGVSAAGASAATDTLSVTDIVNGGLGTDTMNITYTAITADATAAAQISGVEVFNIRNTAAVQNKVILDATKVSGLTKVNANVSTGEVAVTGLATGAAGGIIGNGVLTTGGFEMGYSTASFVPTINLDGGVKQTAGVATAGVNTVTTGLGIIVTAGTASTATINSTGAANVTGGISLAPGAANMTAVTINAATNLTISDAAGTADILGWKAASAASNKLTIAGAATLVTVNHLDASIGIVDASGLTTGGVSAIIGATTQVITGGQGNDTITTNGVQTGAVAAGAGTADRLIVSNTADIAATPAAKYTGFEVLRNTGGGATLDVSTIAGITSIELGATGQGAAKMSAAQAAAVTNLADNATLTLALNDATGISDVLNVTLNGSTLTGLTSTSADLTALTATGFETMTVTSSSGTQGNTTPGNDLAFAAAANLTALTIAGAYDLSLTTASITSPVTITSTQTGSAVLNVSGTLAKGSSVTTTANIDTVTTTATVAGTTGDFVTYNMGAGNDAITSTLAGLNNTSAATGSVKIDGGLGTDTLNLDDGTYADANFQYVTNVEKLTFTGAGVLNLTTGGFFDNNFKTSGVTFTDATMDGGTYVIDATSFTGTVTTALTQSAVGLVGDIFTIKSGSAADTIAFTASKALTSTTSVINTGNGNDTVTLTDASGLGAAGKISITLGQGNDTLSVAITGAGLLDITGGAGADTMALGSTVHTGVFNLIQGIGDSGTFVKPTTNTISTTAFDIVTNGNIATDTITLANATTSAVTQATDLSALTLANDCIIEVKGTYDSVAKTFVGLTGGADQMIIYDSTTGATTTYEAIILLGNGNTDTAALGVITLA